MSVWGNDARVEAGRLERERARALSRGREIARSWGAENVPEAVLIAAGNTRHDQEAHDLLAPYFVPRESI